MRHYTWIGGVIGALLAYSAALSAEPCRQPPRSYFLNRLAPTGGWEPYGGGLIRWWPRHCFPCCGAPDDYCRKPLPRVCLPAYPPFYTWGPPEVCHPHDNCRHSP
jgi:hypothetical protein